MILTSWKEIASRLNCAVRTAQRWERNGLPVNRPIPGRRGHVTANAEMLDSWLCDSVFWRSNDFACLREIQRSRALRSEVRHSRETLRENMASLRRQTALLRHSTQLLHARPHNPLPNRPGSVRERRSTINLNV